MHLKLITLIAAFLLFNPSFGYTETQEIIAEGTYNMGDGETPLIAEKRALREAKRIAVEQAGTYVESYSEIKNSELTKDEIQVLASGITEVEILEKKRTLVGDGIKFWVKIKAIVKADKLDEMVKRVKEKNIVEDYKKLQEAFARSKKEIEKLNKQLKETKEEKGRKKVLAKIKNEEKTFSAEEWRERANDYLFDKNYDNAVEAFKQVIAIKPDYADAYEGQGLAYIILERYAEAVEAFKQVIAIKPDYEMGYSNLGLAYLPLGRYAEAIEAYKQAIRTKPDYANAYSNLGLAYYQLGRYAEALEAYKQAIRIKPNYADKYYDPDHAEAYCYLGLAYLNLGRDAKAVEAFKQAIAIKPDYVKAYFGQGAAYLMLDKIKSAINVYNILRELDEEQAEKLHKLISRFQAK